MLSTDVDLVVLPELQDYLPGEQARSVGDLERLIVADGRAIDPLIYWSRHSDKVLVDGHRRFAICSKHGLHFDLVEKCFKDLREVKYWMDCNQFARRNITAHERAEIIGRMDKYLEEEKLAGRFSGRIDAEIARKQQISERTVYRAKGHAAALERLPVEVKDRICSGELQITASDLQELSTLPDREIRNIVHEVDSGEFETLGEGVTGVKSNGKPLSFDKPKNGHKIVIPRDDKAKQELVTEDAFKALGMLSKQIDALNELSPNAHRMSNVTSNISNIRNAIKNWGRE